MSTTLVEAECDLDCRLAGAVGKAAIGSDGRHAVQPFRSAQKSSVPYEESPCLNGELRDPIPTMEATDHHATMVRIFARLRARCRVWRQ
jgi:hypothetical protein